MQWGKKERPNLVNLQERQVYFRALSIFAMAKKDLWYESMPRYFSFHMQSSNNNEKSLRRLQTTLTFIVNHSSVFTEVLIIITIFLPKQILVLPSFPIDFTSCAKENEFNGNLFGLATNSMFLWLFWNQNIDLLMGNQWTLIGKDYSLSFLVSDLWRALWADTAPFKWCAAVSRQRGHRQEQLTQTLNLCLKNTLLCNDYIDWKEQQDRIDWVSYQAW